MPKGAPPAPLGSAAKPPAAITNAGARVYTSWPRRAYRCVLDPATNPSDNSFAWSTHGSRTAAWNACIAFVDGKKQ